MEIRRGRAATIEADQAATEAVVEQVGERREPAGRVWCPHRQVAFGRRDTRAAGYERAREAAERLEYPATTRAVGGRAVAFSGGTVAFVHAVPVEDDRTAIRRRYDAATTMLEDALGSLGVDARPGEPADSFCPGSHSLQAGGKLAGLAQRVTSEVATVAGVVLVADRAAITDVLSPVYDHLGVPFDPASVGDVASAGGPAEPESVADAIADALASR